MMTDNSQTHEARYMLRNPVGENEWRLQDECTKEWSENGLHISGIGQLTLVAFEVMFPSWRINEKRKPPWTPSIDFLFLNETNQFVLLEMKYNPSPGKLLKALCQVSTMAIQVQNSFTKERLTSAHSACVAKAGNRTFMAAHQEHLIHERIHGVDLGRVYRIVASVRPEDKCRELLSEFNGLSHAQILQDMLMNRSRRRHFELFANLDPQQYEKLRVAPVRYLTIQGQ